MGQNAVGLEQVGGVTQGAQRNLEVQDTRAQRARQTTEMANQLQGRNFGPAMRTQVAGKMNQAGAQGASARHSAEYDVRKVEGERAAVRGHDEATQTQTTAASAADATFGSLNRSV